MSLITANPKTNPPMCAHQAVPVTAAASDELEELAASGDREGVVLRLRELFEDMPSGDEDGEGSTGD